MFSIDIKRNLQAVRENIQKSLKKVSRTDEVILVGVTKTLDIDIVNKGIELGIDNIGENKVQEIQEKYSLLEKKPKIHMIGHLQTNKVKYIIDKVDLIHSLDRLSLAEEIQKRAFKNSLVKDVLVQVNISKEESKYGLELEELDEFLEEISNYENIRVRGLMTMAPFDATEDYIREVFGKAKETFENMKKLKFKNFKVDYLSMGMTNDYMIAIEEGSNMVRVGTGIFGKRK